MIISPGIETGIEYFWKRSVPWDWFGSKRWWEIFVEFSGFNGGGGAWIVERWRWNGSAETIRYQPDSLSWEKTKALISEIKSNQSMHPTSG